MENISVLKTVEVKVLVLEKIGRENSETHTDTYTNTIHSDINKCA